MAFVVSILIFIAISGFAMVLGGGIYLFVDVPSLVIVLPPAIAFGIAASSVKAAKDSLTLAFVDQLEVDAKAAGNACGFLQITGNTALYLGAFTTLIGWVSMAANIKAEEFSTMIGPAFAVSLLTMVYALMVKLLCYTAGQKIRFRYLS